MRRLKRGAKPKLDFLEPDASQTSQSFEEPDELFLDYQGQPDSAVETDEILTAHTEVKNSKRAGTFRAFIYLSLALICLYLFAPLNVNRVISPALALALFFIFFGALLYIIARICSRLFKLGYKKIAGLLMLAMAAIISYGVLSAYAITYDPVIDKALAARLPERANLICSATTDGSHYEPVFCEFERRVSVEEISQSWLKLAIVAVEDERLPTRIEGPVDLLATIRAFFSTLKGQRQGGSTIQMQLAKLLMGKLRTNLSDKDTQTLLAIRLDQRFADEDEILALYCSLCSIDGDSTGMAFAASDFFSISDLRDLSIAQSALLAGMLRSPSAYDPRLHPDAARGRRDLVLKKMYEQKFISEQQYNEATKEPINIMGQLKPYELFFRAGTISHRLGGKQQ